jgi:hypothetical protein
MHYGLCMTAIKRYPLSLRTTKELRQKLEKASAHSGRSLAQEIEFRLERSFEREYIEHELSEHLKRAEAEWRQQVREFFTDVRPRHGREARL